MRKGRHFDLNHVVGLNNTTFTGHGHDACLADQLAIRPTSKDGGQQPGLEALDLSTRVTKTRDFQNHPFANAKTTTFRQTKQIDAARSNVLAHVTGCDLETLGSKLLEQFSVD